MVERLAHVSKHAADNSKVIRLSYLSEAQLSIVPDSSTGHLSPRHRTTVVLCLY